MSSRIWRFGAVATIACGAAIVASNVLARFGPAPSAAMALGSEDAFAIGLHERELAPRSRPLRWTRARAIVRFRHVPPGRARLVTELRGHRGPVRVLVGGTVVIQLGTDSTAAEAEVRVPDNGQLDVHLLTEAFRAGDGRLLGTQLQRVALFPERSWQAPGLAAVFLVPALAAAIGAALSGWAPLASLSWALAAVLSVAVSLWPWGVFRSPYAWDSALTIAAASLVGAVVALLARRPLGRRARWGFVVTLAAAVLLLLPATSPLMVASDVVFQGHMLDRVAHGDWLPTSVTQHAVPFRIPYGVSFFALLAPLRLAGFDPVALVRWAAALAGATAVIGLFLGLASWDGGKAVLAAILLLVVPGTFIVLSQGNLPNAFGQALTILFFTWWVTERARGWLLGAVLGGLAGTAHLSCAFVLLALLVMLLPSLRHCSPDQRRRRSKALVGAAAVTIGYYAAFVPLIVRQLPRLGEGPGARVGTSLWQTLVTQGSDALAWWGAPAMILAVVGCRRVTPRLLGQSLIGFWAAGGLLCLAALLSPVEVRYVYALTAPLAVSASVGLERLWKRGFGGRLVGASLFAAQLVVGIAGIVDRVLHAYR